MSESYDFWVKIIQAAISAFSVVVAYKAASRSVGAAREKSESDRLERWSGDFVALVRDPMITLLREACREVEAIVDTCAIRYSQTRDDATIAQSCSSVQEHLLTLRTDLSVLALSADEHLLLEGLKRALGLLEDDLLSHIGSFPTRVPDQNERRRTIHGSFARLQRGVIQYGKDARSRLRTPLKKAVRPSE